MERIYLSPPHMSGFEEEYVRQVFRSNWIAPLGPQVDAFEAEFAEKIGAKYALALSSGTAAIHLSLLLAGVGRGDTVFVSTLTFAASVFPILYLGAEPVFIDCEKDSWNMDPDLLLQAIERKAGSGKRPKAILPVHLYGQSADMKRITAIGRHAEAVVIEDAAEALGASFQERSPGTFGWTGIFSFNGNKIITTSGGGMLVSQEKEIIDHARKLATQAREPLPHYEHCEIGYNYRMSNVLAGIGRGQLKVLDERVAKKRWIFEYYRQGLQDLPGIRFMPEAAWGKASRWLTVLTIAEKEFGADCHAVRHALELENIESRPVWKPMHLQQVFRGYEKMGGEISEQIFNHGLCLPSGTALTERDLDRIISLFRRVPQQGR